MFNTLCHPETLHKAWLRVRRNGAATGGDGETAREFARNLDSRLARLSGELHRGKYRAGRLRHVNMRRADGRIRRLRIPGLADRVVQTACQRLLSARFDRRMSNASYGYRPARSVPQALDRLCRLSRGNGWLLDADITAFFDNVPHSRLLDEAAIWISDTRVSALIGGWLAAFGGSRGLAQGAPISPVLANLYLHPLDEALSWRGFGHVRYADDFVVLAANRNHAIEASKLAGSVLQRRGLRLNRDKTRVLPCRTGLRFLGQDLWFENRGLAWSKAGYGKVKSID